MAINRKNYVGKNNPFYGKHHTQKTKNKIGLANSGKKSPMKGKIYPKEVRQHMGRKKGCTTHNKGLKYEDYLSQEQILKIKEKLSKIHTGKKLSKKHRKILSVYNSGRKFSKERNLKLSLSMMGNTNPSKLFISRKKISAKKQGISLEEWSGFVSTKKYDELFYCKIFKLKIKRRDNYECAICSNKDNRNIVHHIDGNKQNTSFQNCITVCRSCHNKIHGSKFKQYSVICNNKLKGIPQ